MKQHRADGVSLVFGSIFLIIAAWWTVGWFVDIDLNIPNFGWVVAFGLIAIGLVGVVGSLRGNGNGNGNGAATAPAPGELTDPAATTTVAQEDDTAVDGLPPVTSKDD